MTTHSLPFRLSARCSDSFPGLCSLGSTIEFLVKVSARDEDNILTLVHELFTAHRALAKSIVFSFCSGRKGALGERVAFVTISSLTRRNRGRTRRGANANGPRMEEPSKPRPSLKEFSFNSLKGRVKCCQVPKVSTNFTSTILAPAFLAISKACLGVLMGRFCLILHFIRFNEKNSPSPKSRTERRID